MRYLPLTRYIPPGSVKVASKQSDAVAYVFTNSKGRPAAVGYAGKSAKPLFHFYFANEAARERRVREFFDGQAATKAYKANRAAERKAKLAQGHKLQLGHILKSTWGYDQTNVDFYQVTALIGTRMVEIRQISAVSDQTGWATGNCTPRLDSFKGEAFRKLVNEDGVSVKIESFAWASLWDGRPANWTAYA
jgi:hypothetical protein